jgi:hypothetical protein
MAEVTAAEATEISPEELEAADEAEELRRRRSAAPMGSRSRSISSKN